MCKILSMNFGLLKDLFISKGLIPSRFSVHTSSTIFFFNFFIKSLNFLGFDD